MEIQIQPKASLAIFNSLGSHGLTVGMSVYDFGIKLPDRGEATAEEFQLIEYDLLGKPMGLKQVKFGFDGVYEAYHPLIMDCLRLHPQNQANGGDAFMEVPQEAIHQSRVLAGIESSVIPDGGLNDEERSLLAKLWKYANTQLLPPAVDNAIKIYERVVEQFQVTGARAPKHTERPGRIKVRLEDLVELLEGTGIRVEPPTEKQDSDNAVTADIQTEHTDEGRGDT